MARKTPEIVGVFTMGVMAAQLLRLSFPEIAMTKLPCLMLFAAALWLSTPALAQTARQRVPPSDGNTSTGQSTNDAGAQPRQAVPRGEAPPAPAPVREAAPPPPAPVRQPDVRPEPFRGGGRGEERGQDDRGRVR